MTWRSPLVIAIVAGLLGACSTTQPAAERTAFADEQSDAVAEAGSAAGSSMPTGPSGDLDDYRIGALDVLEVTVFQVPDLDKTVQVSSGGQIALPLIGVVQAGGKTVEELRVEITEKLGATYLQSPQVSVFVKDAQSQRVTVEGAVNKPGIYTTSGSGTLLQVIALAGGLDRVADSRGVVVFREENGKRKAAVFDYASIRAGRSEDPVIRGGDVVVVDQSGLKATMRDIRESVGVIGLFLPLL